MATATKAKPRITMAGLDGLLDLNALEGHDADAPASAEAPRMALDLIDDSPTQPRQSFDEAELQELADSIRIHGVLEPVSLYPHPDVPGRFVLNFGHRRCHASRLAGLADVPYFVMRKLDSFAQVVENEQRANLSAMELAIFIRDRMAEGLTQQDIAQRLGKSKGFISKAAALIDAPAVVVNALQDKRINGVTEAYMLTTLHAKHPQAVDQWAAQQEAIPRAAITALQAQLDTPAVLDAVADPQAVKALQRVPVEPGSVEQVHTALNMPKAKEAKEPKEPPPAKAKAVLMGEYQGKPLELDTENVPPAPGFVFGRRPGAARRLTVPAGEVRLTGFTLA